MKKLLCLGLVALSVPVVSYKARAEDSVQIRISFNKADAVANISGRLSWEARKLQNIVSRVLDRPGGDYGKSLAERTDEVRAAMEAERFITSVNRFTRLTSGRDSVRSSYFSLPPLIQVMRENFNQLVWALDSERQGDTDNQVPGAVRVDVGTILGRGRLNISIAVGEGPDAHQQVARILTNISNMISELEGCRPGIIEERRVYDAPPPAVIQPPREYPPQGGDRGPRGPGRGDRDDRGGRGGGVNVNINVEAEDNRERIPLASGASFQIKDFERGGGNFLKELGERSFQGYITGKGTPTSAELIIGQRARGGGLPLLLERSTVGLSEQTRKGYRFKGSIDTDKLREGRVFYLLVTDENGKTAMIPLSL